MNDTIFALQRADSLNAIAKWLVFTFGRNIEDGRRGGRTYQIVNWRGDSYMRFDDTPDGPPAGRAVKQRRLPSGFKVSSQS